MISIDTMRADRLPAYGYKAGRTPAIDALAQEGVLFERAYTHSPQTLPAHVSILSGQLPQHHGVRDNVGFKLAADVRLLPSWLREHGYVSAGIVSAAVLREETGIGNSFDLFDARMPPTRGGAALDEAQRDGQASLSVARQWLEQRPSPAFLLFLHLYEPHAPYQPPDPYRELAPYDGEIAYADAIVGQLLTALRARGWYDAATVVLLSDHGEGLGDHGEEEHGLFLYEEAIRVPLIIKMPRTRKGTRVATVVQHVDLLPTLLDVAGVAVPQDLPGRSLRPLLESASADEWPERSVYSEALFGRYQFGWSEIFSLTDARYRFIQAPRPELYDLESDPRERQNLVTAKSQTARAMGGALSQLRGSGAVTEPTPVAPDVQERLSALGYVGPQSGPRPARTDRPDPKDKVKVLTEYSAAMRFASEGELDDALARLHRIAQQEPAMPDVWLTIGRLLLRKGRTKEAVSAFRRYVGERSTSVAGLLEISAAQLALQRFQDATAHAELAVSVAEERGDRLAAHEMLVRIALAKPDISAARRAAEAAAAIDADYPLGDFVEGRIAYADGRFDQAVTFFERAVRASQSHTLQIRGLHLYAGDALAHVGRFTDAEREFRHEIQFFRDSMYAYLSLANLYQTFGRKAEAEQVLGAMLRAVPSGEAHAAARKLRGSA